MYKKQSHSHSSRKKVLLITAAVLVLLIAGGTVVYLNRDQFFPGARSDEQNGASEQQAASADVVASSQQLASSGEADAANSLLDESIAGASSDAERADYFAQKAAIAFSSNPSLAVEYLVKAAEIQQTVGAYTSVASMAEEAGNRAVAIEYYAKALDAMSKIPVDNQDPASYPPDYYERKLENLRAQ